MELYIHIPFCVHKCNYCDFLSFPCGNMGETPDPAITAYVDALCAELYSCMDTVRGRELTSIYIGGGTPSIIPVPLMEKILGAVDLLRLEARPCPKEEFEFTIECNPGTLDLKKFNCYRSHGINRLSLGLQSTDNKELKTLGRIHTYEEFLESYELARRVGFDNINVDLISALPGQDTAKWTATLRKVAELKPEHISAYSLIIEPGTPFYDIYGENGKAKPSILQKLLPEHVKGPEPLPDEDEERRMYAATKDVLKEYGYTRYEISNYALPGRESKHNLGYWTGAEYIGTGLGAASYIKIFDGSGCRGECSGCEQAAECASKKDGFDAAVRYKNTDDPEEYIENCRDNNFTALRRDEEFLKRKEMMGEYMMLHLRLIAGLRKAEFKKRFNCDVHEVYDTQISKYAKLGLLEETDESLRLTDAGLNVSNTVMADFLL